MYLAQEGHEGWWKVRPTLQGDLPTQAHPMGLARPTQNLDFWAVAQRRQMYRKNKQ